MNGVPESITMDDALKWVSVGLCLIAVIAVQFRAFGFGRRLRSPTNIGSFFFPRKILSKRQSNILSIVTMIPLTFVFFVVAGRSSTFLETAIKVYLVNVPKTSPWHDLVSEEMFSAVPESLHPFIILVVFAGLFRRLSEFVFRRVERVVLDVSGLSDTINGTARRFATVLLESCGSYDNAITRLEGGRGKRVPLPVELDEATPDVQLAFQLLFLAEPKIPDNGLRRALQELVEEKCGDVLSEDNRETLGFALEQDVGTEEEEEQARSTGGELVSVPDVVAMELEQRDFMPLVLWEERVSEPRGRDARADWGYMISSVVVYLFVCILYVIIVPAASEPIQAMGVSWPEPFFRLDLVWDVGVVTVATILPVLVGMTFVVRRSMTIRETAAMRIRTVLLSVFSFSFVMYFVNVLRVLSEYYLGDRSSKSDLGPHLLEFPEWVYIICHALVPCVAVLVLTIGDSQKMLARRREMISGGRVVAGIGAIAAGHALAYFIFEVAADYSIHYYVHQALLAAVLGATALLMFRRYWKPRSQVRT